MSLQDQLSKAKDPRDVLMPKKVNVKSKESLNLNTMTEHKDVSVHQNIKVNNEYETMVLNNESDHELLNKYVNKKKKLTVEDTHERYTFLMDKKLKKRFFDLAEGEDRGFKTELLNDALNSWLNKLEKMMK